MTARSPEALAQSIHDRLKNEARRRGRPYAELLDLYAIERFLHRLGRSAQRETFVLKGAVLLRQWLGADTRPTRDIDLLGPEGFSIEAFDAALREILDAPVEPDGIEFELDSIRIEPIRAESQVAGLRAKFEGRLGRARVHYQVDAGFGDEVFPPPEDLAPGDLLGLEQATVRAYTPYTSIAEKLEAMVVLGASNTRMKDYYDLSELPARLSFDGSILRESIIRTFSRRGRTIGALPLEGLSDDFGDRRINTGRWRTFLSRGRLDIDADLSATIATIRRFIDPVLIAARDETAFDRRWPVGGPWCE